VKALVAKKSSAKSIIFSSGVCILNMTVKVLYCSMTDKVVCHYFGHLCNIIISIILNLNINLVSVLYVISTHVINTII
jgi:hypothetical protein